MAARASTVAPEAVSEIRPQAGPQEAFLASPADIAIVGGAAGGGKTFGLLLEPLRHVSNRHFGAVIFRRTYPQIRQEGGLWDEAAELYPLVGGTPNENDLTYRFGRHGAAIQFAHLQHSKDRLAWKGSQIPLLEFDQLEDFEEQQFWYLLTRNRSARAGIQPYCRATCNPVPEDDPIGGWLHRLIQWWINPETGYAIPERSGVLRWFARVDERLYWGDTREEVIAQFPGQDIRPKSLTFIAARLDDNPALEAADPDYRSWLMSQPLVDRERLLNGNWNIKPTAGKVFNRAWFRVISARPAGQRRTIRYWDKAATEGGGAYSAGVRVSVAMTPNDPVPVAIEHVIRGQWSALQRETVIQQTAQADGRHVDIWVEQEPGSGGKESAQATIRNLSGFVIHAERVTGDKITRAKPLSSQAEAGNVFLVADGAWSTEDFLREAHAFDAAAPFKDQIDAASGAYNKATTRRRIFDTGNFGRLEE
jgi:predicted phage terminase large subunit-like protein